MVDGLWESNQCFLSYCDSCPLTVYCGDNLLACGNFFRLFLITHCVVFLIHEGSYAGCCGALESIVRGWHQIAAGYSKCK